jgi:hypothetical protein
MEIADKLFDKLSGLGEVLLGTYLHRVLVRVGAIDESEPLRGFTLVEYAERFLSDKRTDAERLAAAMGCLRKAKSDIEHARRYLASRQKCFCKDLDGGEHAAYPACSMCVLGRLEADLKRAIG